MEKNPEEMKVMHSQHARILKEDDEIWISSEDLNTENSSDEDRSRTKHAFKKKLKLKDRKRSSPNIRLQRPSIPSVHSMSKELDDRLLMPATDDIHSRSTDESRTSDEECPIPPISSECLSKRLSLEDWRPMRGALNISSLEETASAADDTRKTVNEIENFYDEMLYKLKSLKSCSVLESAQKEKLEVNEKLDVQEKVPVVEKTFKYLKNTPEVKQKLDFINKLDEEINETISRYKAEREERLQAEFQMCENISKQKIAEERGTNMFLRMCNFEERLKKYHRDAQDCEIGHIENSEDTESIQDTGSEITTNINEENNNDARYSSEKNFIRKNIYAAKEGMMACFSLTDEEKTKIANILKDIDDFQMDDAELTLSEHSLIETSKNNLVENTLEQDLSNAMNAFEVFEKDKLRMGEIDSELEKFTQDQELKENDKKPIPVVRDDEFWKKYVLDHSLKEIDAKLERLYASYAEDEEKLKQKAHDDEDEEEKQEEPTDQLELNEDDHETESEG